MSLLLIALTSVTAQLPSEDTLRYVAMRGSTVVKRVTVWTDSSDATVVRSRSFPDSAMSTTTRIRFDRRTRAPVWLESSGTGASGGSVEERFVLTKDTAEWKNPGESVRRRVGPGVVYVPWSHAVLQAVLPSLLAAPRNKPAATLPVGFASAENEGSFAVFTPAGTERVTQFALPGISPDRVWIDKNSQLFSDGTLIREGWHDALRSLRDSAESAQRRERERNARTLRRVPNRPLVIRHARLFDAATRSVVEDATVVIRDSLVVAVGSDAQVRRPENAEVIDGRGRFLMPGLWDMHAHDFGYFGVEFGALNLAGGVTTVREHLHDTLSAIALAARPALERSFGPRILWSGVLEGSGGRRTVHHATTESAVRLLVKRYKELGASQIKLYGLFQRRLVPIAIAEARRHGLRVGGHMAAGMPIKEALDAGYEEISHITNFTANFRGDSIWLGRGWFGSYGMRRAASIDVKSDSIREFVSMLKNHGVAFDPTMNVEEPSVRVGHYLVRPNVAGAFERLSPYWARFYVGWSPEPDTIADVWRRGFENLKAVLRSLHEAGIPILPGTDDLPGFTLHRELEIYAEAGIPRADVLYLATLGAARVMRADDRLGSIAVGKAADLILIDGDPLRDMRDIRRVVLTVKDGAVYDPATLYRALAIRPCCDDETSPRAKR